MDRITEKEVRERLRQVRWPGFDTNIVAAGFLESVTVQAGRVIVSFRPRTGDRAKVTAMEAEIRGVLKDLDGIEEVRVISALPVLDPVLREEGCLTPLAAEVKHAGIVPDPDPMLSAPPRWDGRRPDRRGVPRETRYTGDVPVYQWEIDPMDSEAESGEAHLTLGDWEYRMWWQVHPLRLVYASIQAIQDDTVTHASAARPHPVGRAVAVNLVFDDMRRAIVAIYGTATDFRPFVEAFQRGYGLLERLEAVRTTEGEAI